MLEAAIAATETNPFTEDDEAIMLDPIRSSGGKRLFSGMSKRPGSSTRASSNLNNRNRQLVRYESARGPMHARSR